MQTLTTLDQLDEKLAECDAAGRVSDAALRQVFSTFRMDFSQHVPPDPFSAEYRDVQMAMYQRLTGISYETKNEKTKFDVAKADRQPFPYYTGSCKTVGFFTMGVGSLLYALNLAPGARVLEFGAGWGNTTIAMALSGLRMTALDIESDFCDLLELRAKRHELDITVINADFMWAETVTEPFDAAIFFESFHHCSDHMRLLRALQTAVKPGGRIYFGAEPIVGRFSNSMGPAHGWQVAVGDPRQQMARARLQQFLFSRGAGADRMDRNQTCHSGARLGVGVGGGQAARSGCAVPGCTAGSDGHGDARAAPALAESRLAP